MTENQANPLVSVIIITYNQEKFIKETVLSVLNQKGNYCLEVLVFDDNSNDLTQDKINALNYHPNFTKVQYQKNSINLGIYANFRLALRNCKGDYIAICEGDDYWIDENKLQKQIDILRYHSNVSAVYSGFKVLENGAFSEKIRKNHKSTKYLSDKGFWVYKRWWNESFLLGQTATLVFRRSSDILDSILKEFRNYGVAGDKILQVCLMNFGYLAYIPECLTVYRVHQGGVSFNNIKSKQHIYNDLLKLERLAKSKYSRRIVKYRLAFLRFYSIELDLKIYDLLLVFCDSFFYNNTKGFYSMLRLRFKNFLTKPQLNK